MNPYTSETLPDTGGYNSARRPKSARPRRSPGALFRTDRRVRYLVCAAIIVLGAVSVPVLHQLLATPQPQMITALRTLPAGHVITPGDLGTVNGSVPAGSGIPASMESQLLGRQLQLEVPQGALLAPGELGAFPPTGMTVVPVAVKPGQYPPNLQDGDLVGVFPISDASGTAAQPAPHGTASARVVQLQATDDSSGTTVVLLEVSTAQAPAVAQASGVVLVTLDAAGDLP